jgi:hypothetical protein
MHGKDRTDIWAGLMFSVIGAGFAIGALNYSFGHAARPGPGYFPFGLGLLLLLLGLVILARAVLARPELEEKPFPIAWKPLAVTVGSIVVFGLALPVLGMLLTLPLLIVTISAAGDQFRWRDVLLNSVVLTAGSWVVFIKGLSLTIPVWPGFLA